MTTCAPRRHGNVNTAKGNFDGPSRAYTINANDQLKSTKDYEKLIVAFRNGSPVRLVDVATSSSRPKTTSSRLVQHDAAVILNIQRQPGANVIKVVEGVRLSCPRSRRPCARDRRHRAHGPHRDDPCLDRGR